MSAQNETKKAVTVAEMARMCGLSRSRFYQLIGSAFPQPERQPKTGTEGNDQGEVLRAVFLQLKRQNSADNVR